MHLKFSHTARLAIATSAAAAAIAPTALAAGEPKNEPPFTRPVVTIRVTEQLVHVGHVSSSRGIRGEPKNELPFTRRVLP
jgi:hypothetical protein